MTEKEIAEWMTHPVTIVYMRRLRNMINELQDELGGGSTLVLNDSEATLGFTARSVGTIEGIMKALEAPDEIVEE